MLNSLFSENTASIELGSILLCTLTSLVLGIVVAFTHKLTSRHNKNFLVTLAILPLLVQIVMIMVNGNLGTSVAILGAFGLIRFRSVPGTSKDILSIFFSMAIGLATGMGYLGFAALMTIVIALAIAIFSKFPLLASSDSEQILRIAVPEDLDYTTIFDDVFQKYTRRTQLEKAKTTDMGSLFDLHYRITLKDGINEKEFIDALRERNGNLRIVLSQRLTSEAEI